MDRELFGWEILYKTIENNIKRESDVLIALAHWFFIRNASLLCVGIGDDKTLGENETGSELLPNGWNENDATYALRYTRNRKLYLLLGTISEDNLLMNFLDPSTREVSNLMLNPTEVVKSLKGPIKTMIPDFEHILERYKKELVEPIIIGKTKEVTTQTPQNQQQESSRVHDIGGGYILPPPLLFTENRFPGNPLSVGRGDLDPFGRGGGMLFPDPDHHPLLVHPRGGGPFPPPPPGSRFDPIIPDNGVDIGRNPIRPRGEPNPDHFRPPPDFDDMYL